MCGINGFRLKNENNHLLNLRRIKIMNENIIYRGPDEEGVYIKDNVGLGMRRLSIIDLSSGSQPIFNEDKSIAVILNGEIYNYRVLRDELKTKGHNFYTQSDTEVIPHLYEEYGEECFKYLSGMFAIAIYDIVNNKIILARDRIGEKPLYYYNGEIGLIFCSELKSMLTAFREIKFEIDKIALNQYFSLTYIPAPLTIFQNIYKLQPSEYLVYENDKVTISSYWNLDISTFGTISDDEYCKQEIRRILFESVQSQMVSDVSLGAFLSGGIDSSIIVGIMSKISSIPVETFSVGFKERDFDESSKAKVVSDFNRTHHHKFILRYDDVLEQVDNIVSFIDEPFADSSMLPTYFVSKLSSQHVKVVLTGDAGDELFGGYSKYMIDYYSEKYRKIPPFLRKNLIEKITYSLPDTSIMSRKIRKVVDNLNCSDIEQRKRLMMLGTSEDIRKAVLNDNYYIDYSMDFIDKAFKKIARIDLLNRTEYIDLKYVLEGDILTKVDRMSMRNSIETRVPMLSPEMVEFAFKISPSLKIKGRNQKYILKEAFSDMLPESILKQSKKGFGVPIGQWLKGPLYSKLNSYLSKEKIDEQGIFNYDAIDIILKEHIQGRKNHSSFLWSMYVFQGWYDRVYMK